MSHTHVCNNNNCFKHLLLSNFVLTANQDDAGMCPGSDIT